MNRLGWAIGLGIPAGLAAWTASGAFLPVSHDATGVEYVFHSGSYLWLAAAIVIAVAALIATAADLRRFAPAILLASLDPLALLAFAPGMRPVAGPLVYLAVDMRRWRLAAAAVLALVELDRVRGHAWRRRIIDGWLRVPERTRLRVLDAALVVVAVAFAASTTTYLRFSDLLHGDEPKYVRYCENLFQGNGFDLTDFKNASAVAERPSHVLSNIPYVFDTMRVEARRARQDLRRYERDPNFRWNRGKFIEGWFIYSKTGRIYQVHTPGVSLLLMPFYYVDRVWLSDGTTAYQGQVAGKLLATNTYFLLMYALLGVVTFRLLRNAIGGEIVPWSIAALAIVTMPIAAFAFQMYPETTAGVFTIATINFLAFKSSNASASRAAFYGLLVGYLPWLHVRFTAVAGVLGLWAIVALWRRCRNVAAFVIASGVLIALLCLHVYHITGSPIPSALYTVDGVRESLSFAGVPVGLRGFAVDRGYGLLPYSPYFALAVFGIIPVFRRVPRASAFAAAVVMAAAVSGATHSWTAAGGSPLRYLVAVMPLLLAPLGVAIHRFASSRAFIAVFAALAIVAMQTAVAYNNYHPKTAGPMIDESVSGWKVNLLFPDIKTRRPAWETASDYLPTSAALKRTAER